MNSSANANTETKIIEERITKVNGDFHIKRYAKGSLLGKGGFAKVFHFTNLETNKVMAGKIIPKENLNRSRARQKLMTEIRLHKGLHHPNVVKFEHVFEDQDNVYILLELCQNQTMNELLKRRKTLTEFEVQCYVIQIVEALKYVHHTRIIHRDLKLGNLFLSDKMEVKLGDFGLAAKLEFDGEKKRTICGTPNYIAPEVLDGKHGHSYEVDVWSLGVIIYTLIIGKPPFETSDIKMTYQRIKDTFFVYPENAHISVNAKDLIAKILVSKPEKRPTLDEILFHPFINHGGPIPKYMPVSTLACPPTNSYMKQFASTSTSHRLRISTDFDFLENSDISKQIKPNSMNSLSLPTGPKTPSTNELLNMDFIKMTPKTPNADLVGKDKFNLLGVNSSDKNKPLLTQTPTAPKLKDFIFPSPLNEIKEEQAEAAEETDKGNESPNLQPKTIDEIRVIKWYDYSVKYGMSYILSNGAIGVSFNDGSKLITKPEEKFEYITRKASDKQDVSITYSFKKYPQDIHKKVLIYQHFKEYFEPVIKKTQFDEKDTSVYVKKWIKTKHGIFFRMNNKVLQVNFTDGSILIMNSDAKKLTFVDIKGNPFICNLDHASQTENKDLAKRLKYTEQVLRYIWTAQTENTNKDDDVANKENIPSKNNIPEPATTLTEKTGFKTNLNNHEEGLVRLQ